MEVPFLSLPKKRDIGTHDMIMDSCHLEGLSDDECWSIFRERAFVEGKSPSAELEEIGREIVKRCCGLPLQLHIIGGMLAYHTDKDKWLSIKNSQVWDLADEKERVEKSLKLSFDNLPNSSAKQCFAYCSIFEKDKVMKRKELIQQWMALGFLQADESRNMEMEDVGNEIFQILISHSLFQDVEKDDNGHVTTCRMHDLVHDLSLSLFAHESLCLVEATNDDVACIPQVKHIALYPKLEFKDKIAMFNQSDTVARTLHTLFFIGLTEKNFSFQRFKCIRILKFKGYGMKKLDDLVGQLVHLRYLDLSSTDISVLPESIGKLYNLQTLKLQNCYCLKNFPESMRNLISLRHFKCDKNIPANIMGQWISLRKLPSFTVLRRKGHGIGVLQHLNNLHKSLCISQLENVGSKEDAVKADLSRKKYLYKIEFEWSGEDQGANRVDRDVLDGLQPPRDVKQLAIKNFSANYFPDWVTKMAIDIEGKWTPLDKLVSIRLYDCRSCLSLPTLEHLPHLQDLELWNMENLKCLRSSNVTGLMKPVSPSLRLLRLYNMERLENWIDGATNSSKMISPVLESLSIYHCPKIIHIDECHPHPLLTLKISCCTGLVSIKSIQGFKSLVSFEISYCQSLLGITNLPNQCHFLKTLRIKYCDKLSSLPQKMFHCFAFLNELEIGPFLKELDSFPSLQGIEKLRKPTSLVRIAWMESLGVDTSRNTIPHLTDLVMHTYIWNTRTAYVVNQHVIYPTFEVL